MREVVSVHVGQAGVQLSSALWQLLTVEHGLQANGVLQDTDEDELSAHTFFQQVPSGHFIPRAISVDLEPTVLDEIRVGPYRLLFHPDQLISGFEDAANNFARGHYNLGKVHIDYVVNRLGKLLEMCDNMQGLFVLNSYGGGTGSGFGSLLLDRLNIEFPKKVVIQTSVFPSDKLSTATVEPYNTVLSFTFAIDRVGLCNLFDNESTYGICCKSLNIPRPSYSNLNMIVSQTVSSLTASIRFQGCMNTDFDQMVTNLVPYPRIHFPILAYAPIITTQKALHQPLTIGELTRSAFDPLNQLFNVDMSKGKYMTCCLQYRGQITPKDINDAIIDIKKRPDIRFIDWCPTGFKLGINSQPPAFIPKSEMAETNRSVSLLANSSAISQKLLLLLNKYDNLFHKRCFIHWYVGEGMEEMEIINSRDELEVITLDYFELCPVDDEDEPAYENLLITDPNKEKENNLEEATKEISIPEEENQDVKIEKEDIEKNEEMGNPKDENEEDDNEDIQIRDSKLIEEATKTNGVDSNSASDGESEKT